MSQYPMYPPQLSYLPSPMYGYPANYPYMLGAAIYPGTQAQSQASMITQQQQQTQIQSQASQETGGDTGKEAGARQPETVTVSSSVAEESEERSEYIEELTREKEALGETGNSHAKRLIDRGDDDTRL